MLFDNIKNVVWGMPTALTVLAFGVYFTFKSGLYRPRVLIRSLGSVFSSSGSGNKGGVAPFAAVATALGGTVGVGSIIGVGYGIAVGGPGSVFWMWVCSFFGMGLKYAEVSAALPARDAGFGADRGGAPYRLRRLGKKRLAALFCAACILCSFGTGNVAQAGAAAKLLGSAGAPPWMVSAACGAAVALAVSGGAKRVASLNAVAVPAASAVYLILCAAALVINLDAVPQAFLSVFRSAFGVNAAVGGFSGAALSAALREGVARSVFSNEAGMGSSPLAIASAAGDPSRVRSFGVFEVFFDSFVVSTLTALALLAGGYSDVSSAFVSSFGKAGGTAFVVLTVLFAFASVIAWYFYGESCLVCLFGEKRLPVAVYRVLFTAVAAAAAAFPLEALIGVSDVFNALMMIPNLCLLFICRNEIKNEAV